MIEVGKFKCDPETGDIYGPAEYMKTAGAERIAKIAAGHDTEHRGVPRPALPEGEAVMSAGLDAVVGKALAKLRAAHADELHVAAGKVANALEDRDAAIVAAYRDGMSDADIAELVGLTRQRVWQIRRAAG